jgi:hypothetical protein
MGSVSEKLIPRFTISSPSLGSVAVIFLEMRFQVQVLEVQAPWGWSRHLKVQRTDGRDGITWDDLQKIKDEYLGTDVAAVEFYPPATRVVNELNMRHLYEVPVEWLPM